MRLETLLPGLQGAYDNHGLFHAYLTLHFYAFLFPSYRHLPSAFLSPPSPASLRLHDPYTFTPFSSGTHGGTKLGRPLRRRRTPVRQRVLEMPGGRAPRDRHDSPTKTAPAVGFDAEARHDTDARPRWRARGALVVSPVMRSASPCCVRFLVFRRRCPLPLIRLSPALRLLADGDDHLAVVPCLASGVPTHWLLDVSTRSHIRISPDLRTITPQSSSTGYPLRHTPFLLSLLFTEVTALDHRRRSRWAAPPPVLYSVLSPWLLAPSSTSPRVPPGPCALRL